MPNLPSALGFSIFLAKLIIATALLRLLATQLHDTPAGRALAFVAP